MHRATRLQRRFQRRWRSTVLGAGARAAAEAKSRVKAEKTFIVDDELGKYVVCQEIKSIGACPWIAAAADSPPGVETRLLFETALSEPRGCANP